MSTTYLTSADLKNNLHDIQDNVVAPILMRYGRHLFVKFTDGGRARDFLRNMLKRVNARPEEHGTRFTVNLGFTFEGLKAMGLSRGSLDTFPEAFRTGMRGRAGAVGDVGPHAPEHWSAASRELMDEPRFSSANDEGRGALSSAVLADRQATRSPLATNLSKIA